MNIKTHSPVGKNRIEITVSGPVNQENAKGIIHRALFETSGSKCDELILDLRKADLESNVPSLQLHTLLQIFRSIVLRDHVQLMLLMPRGGDEQWTRITKAKEFDGVNMQVFNSRETAQHYLGTCLHQESASVH